MKSKISIIKDFPKEGINFLDISPLLADKDKFNEAIETMASKVDGETLLGLESRGFIFASAMAIKSNTGFVMLRKKGKLPGEVISEKYSLEYGESVIEMKPGVSQTKDVIIVDDVVATGGSLVAAINLARRDGLNVVKAITLIEIEGLQGRDIVEGTGVPLITLIKM